MERQDGVKKAVGRADVCELLASAFSFPDERLAAGLCDGALAADAEACLRDAGADEAVAQEVADGLRAWAGGDAAELCARMRKTYSRLYLAPGGRTPVFPYESAFLHVERELPGIPTLFRSPVTLDVERQMRGAGVVAKNGRKEPCDSVFEEFEFLSYLFAKQADALSRMADDEAVAWGERARTFARDHVLAWLPQFMRRTQELADGEPYAALAVLGAAALEAIV